MQPHLLSVQFRHQITARINSDSRRALNSEFDRCRVGARRDSEIVFQFARLGGTAVVNEVDAGVDARIADSGEPGDVCPPLGVLPQEVVALAGKFPKSHDSRRGICSYQLHPQDSEGSRFGAAE